MNERRTSGVKECIACTVVFVCLWDFSVVSRLQVNNASRIRSFLTPSMQYFTFLKIHYLQSENKLRMKVVF